MTSMFAVDEIFLKMWAFRAFQISNETSIGNEGLPMLASFWNHILPPFLDRVKIGPILGLNVKKTQP
jgi:hypothetical protein